METLRTVASFVRRSNRHRTCRAGGVDLDGDRVVVTSIVSLAQHRLVNSAARSAPVSLPSRRSSAGAVQVQGGGAGLH